MNFAGGEMRPVNNMKVLGVTLDPELRLEDYVSTMICKSYATLAGLAKFAKKLPTEVKKSSSWRHCSPPTSCTALLYGADAGIASGSVSRRCRTCRVKNVSTTETCPGQKGANCHLLKARHVPCPGALYV